MIDFKENMDGLYKNFRDSSQKYRSHLSELYKNFAENSRKFSKKYGPYLDRHAPELFILGLGLMGLYTYSGKAEDSGEKVKKRLGKIISGFLVLGSIASALYRENIGGVRDKYGSSVEGLLKFSNPKKNNGD